MLAADLSALRAVRVLRFEVRVRVRVRVRVNPPRANPPRANLG